jgi:predicted DNA-binding protein
MPKQMIGLRLPPAVLAKLDSIAKMNGKPRAVLAEEIITKTLEYTLVNI